MISSTQIANMALSHVGARGTIESLNEQSVEALTCRIWYDLSRTTSLEAHDWSFAKKKVVLALDGDDPPIDWLYRYEYPADCLVARQIVIPSGMVYYNFSRDGFRDYINSPDAYPFAVELNTLNMKTIVTDVPEATLHYTRNVTDTSSYSSHFALTMSYSLASMIAFKLTGKMATKQAMEQMFLFSVRSAAGIDANQGIEKAPKEADWIRARG